jgi:dihydroorotate dehydrogenase
MGFGFIEVGTVTPKAQPGNPKPRMFRLPRRQALINRWASTTRGWRLRGQRAARTQLPRARRHPGLNIGKNAATPIERAADDYLLGLDGVYPHADYVTVNISSPNTKNLRALQSDEALDALLGALRARRDELATRHGRTVPMFLKIAPDLDDAQIGVIAATLRKHGMDGVIATNTTIARDAVQGLPHAGRDRRPERPAGLRGQQPRDRGAARALGPGFPIIGVGGVMSGARTHAPRSPPAPTWCRSTPG